MLAGALAGYSACKQFVSDTIYPSQEPEKVASMVLIGDVAALDFIPLALMMALVHDVVRVGAALS